MKDVIRMSGIISLVLAMVFSFAACSGVNDPATSLGDDTGGGSLPPPEEIFPVTSVSKFQANSFIGTDEDRIKYSYTYNEYEYYYIYLGELKNVPMFYRDARYYGGNTQWTYTFSTTDITENFVRNAVATSSQEAIDIVVEHTYSETNGEKIVAEIGYKLSIMDIFDIKSKVTAEDYWSDYTSDTTANSFQKTTSLTNTVEHATTYTFQTMEEDQWVYTPADKIGYYRWTLFSASDVYLYAIRNSADGGIYYEFREHVIPGAYFWSMDYSETPSFRKSDATSFVLDISILDNLPKPELVFTGVPSYTVVYNANGGSGTMEPTFHEYGIEQNLRQNTFTAPIGHSFSGWARSATAANAEFTDEQNVFNLTEGIGTHITLYAVWREMKLETERRVFTTAGNSAYIFNKGFPATIEIFSLGAGGGGQGGHYSAVIKVLGIGGTPSTGTGGAGGGGAAAYMKFSVAEPVTFNIAVGRGGTGGAGVSRSNTQEWQSGEKGNDGGNTTVSWGTNTLTARGGAGGGGSGQILTGGNGGTANTVWPSGNLDKFSLAGGKGTDGIRGLGSGGDKESRGGNAAAISIGSETLFGGGTGALRPAGKRPQAVGIGGGGSGEYGSSRSGSPGGDGYVIIVVTYYE